MNDSAFRRLTAPLRRRIKVLFTRGIVRLVDASMLMQSVQAEILAGDLLDGVEHFEPYGFTARPHPGAEGLFAALGGDRSHTVCIAIADRQFRLKALASGEVALYDDQDQKIHLKRDGIHIQTGLKVTIEAGATVEVMGATGAPVKGVVQGDCLCAYTGAPHPMISANVKGSV